MKKVVIYGENRKLPLFVGTETECRKWIFSQASDHIKLDGGKLLVREIKDLDGTAYDVGQPVMYQIVEADGNETKGIYND